MGRNNTWQFGLNRGELKAIRAFESFTDFEPVSKHQRVGLPSLEALVRRGLADEGPKGIFGRTFMLNTAGQGIAAQVQR